MVLSTDESSSSDEEEILQRLKQNQVEKKKQRLKRILEQHGVNCAPDLPDLTLIHSAITILSASELKVKARERIRNALQKFRLTFDPSWKPVEDDSPKFSEPFTPPSPRPPSLNESEIDECTLIDWDNQDEGPRLPSNPYIQTESKEAATDNTDSEHENLPCKTPKKKRKRPLFVPSGEEATTKKPK